MGMRDGWLKDLLASTGDCRGPALWVRLATVAILVVGGTGLLCLAFDSSGIIADRSGALVATFTYVGPCIAFLTAVPATIAISAIQDRRLWWVAAGALTICASAPTLAWFALVGIGQYPTNDQVDHWLGWMIALPIVGTGPIVLILIVEPLLRRRSVPSSARLSSPAS